MNLSFSQKPADKKQGQGLFSSKPKAPELDSVSVNNQLNNISLRLRVLEERYTNLRRKLQVIEQNMLNGHRQLKDDTKVIDSELTESKRDIAEINNRTRQIILELRNCAQKEEMSIVKKYVEMWEPVNFVTSSQVEKIVREEIEAYFAQNKSANKQVISQGKSASSQKNDKLYK